MIQGKDLTDRIHHGKANGTLKLADVAGPIVALQPSDHLGLNRANQFPVFAIEDGDEMLHQIRNVIQAARSGGRWMVKPLRR